MIHSNLVGASAIHQAAYFQASDPGAVGAKKLWFDTTDPDAVLIMLRNDDNDDWIDITPAGGGGGGGSEPTTPLASALILVEADAGLSGLSDGDPVSTWEDQGAIGNDLTGTSTARPTFREEDASDGLPFVEFDGSNDVLTKTAMSAFTGSEFTIYFVVRWNDTSPGSFRGLASFVNAADADWNEPDHIAITTYSNPFAVERNSVPRLGPALTLSGTGATHNPRAFQAIAVRYKTVMGSGTLSIWRGAIEAHYDVTLAAMDVSVVSLGSRYLSGAAGNFLRADVRAMGLYPSGHTDAEVAHMLRYLSNKWGVPRI